MVPVMMPFLRSLLVVVFLIGIVVGATIFADTIRGFFSSQVIARVQDVKGASTVVDRSSFTKMVTNAVQENAQSAQNQLLQIRVVDILNAFTRAQKVAHAVTGVQQQVHTFLQQMAK